MINLMMLKEAVYSTGISKGWSKEKCEIEFIKAMAREAGIELTDEEAKKYIEENRE